MGSKDTTAYIATGGDPVRFADALDGSMPWFLHAPRGEDDEPDTIPDGLYQMLPAILQDGVRFFREGHERAVFLTAALPVVAGALPTVLGKNADGWGPLNIYTIITARAGSGKGALRFARVLGAKIDERLVAESTRSLRDWQTRREVRDDAGERPPGRTFFLAGNSSARALADNLAANRGHGVIAESEIATLAATLGQDWGNFSDVLLKAFHGEYIALDRKQGESIRIPKPAISMTLSGTPAALQTLIPSTETGLFSRIAFYTFTSEPQWRSQRPKQRQVEQDQFFESASLMLDELHAMLECRPNPLYVTWEDHQWNWHDVAFRMEFRRLVARHGDSSLEASIKRAGVIAFRIGCILSVVRHFEHRACLEAATSIQVHDEDARAGIMLALVYYRHALSIAERMPRTSGPRLHGKQREFYEALPPGEFSSEVYRTIAHALKMTERTARRYLDYFASVDLVSKRSYGVYEKSPEAAIESCLPIIHEPLVSDEPHIGDKSLVSDEPLVDDEPMNGVG